MIDALTDFFNSIGSFFADLLHNIINFCFECLFLLLDLFFGWINIPAFPESLKNSIDTFLSLIFDNLSFLGFFIRPETLRILIPLLLVLFNFEYVYRFIMWIIKKIPMLNIK